MVDIIFILRNFILESFSSIYCSLSLRRPAASTLPPIAFLSNCSLRKLIEPTLVVQGPSSFFTVSSGAMDLDLRIMALLGLLVSSLNWRLPFLSMLNTWFTSPNLTVLYFVTGRWYMRDAASCSESIAEGISVRLMSLLSSSMELPF